MTDQRLETVYKALYHMAKQTAKREHVSFFESLVQVGNKILDVREEATLTDNQQELSKETLDFLSLVQSSELKAEEWRKVWQWTLLKGLTEEPLQANHQLTPDAIGYFIGFLVEKLLGNDKTSVAIMDPAVGTGNLLLAVMNSLAEQKNQVVGFGVEVDDTLIALAAIISNLSQNSVTLYHQDAMRPLLLDPVDIAVGDLPIGYYPDDERATAFEMSMEEGHTYAHHLLIEQSMNHVKEAGFGLFLVPRAFLSMPQSHKFKEWIQRSVYLQAIIALPQNLFKNEASEKSIIILQNKGAQSKQVEVLAASLTSLQDITALSRFFDEFDAWQMNNLK